MKHALKVQSVQRLAFDNEQVHLAGESVDVTIRIKDQEEHGSYAVGDEVELDLPVAAKPKRKKK